MKRFKRETWRCQKLFLWYSEEYLTVVPRRCAMQWGTVSYCLLDRSDLRIKVTRGGGGGGGKPWKVPNNTPVWYPKSIQQHAPPRCAMQGDTVDHCRLDRNGLGEMVMGKGKKERKKQKGRAKRRYLRRRGGQHCCKRACFVDRLGNSAHLKRALEHYVMANCDLEKNHMYEIPWMLTEWSKTVAQDRRSGHLESLVLLTPYTMVYTDTLDSIQISLGFPGNQLYFLNECKFANTNLRLYWSIDMPSTGVQMSDPLRLCTESFHWWFPPQGNAWHLGTTHESPGLASTCHDLHSKRVSNIPNLGESAHRSQTHTFSGERYRKRNS